MNGDLPSIDPKNIWQQQENEVSAMSLKIIQRRAEELRTKTRRERFGNILLVFLCIGLAAHGIWLRQDLILRPLFLVAIAWAIGGHFALYRNVWATTLAAEAGVNSFLDTYRRELKRRRLLLDNVLPWSFGPAVFAIALWIASATQLAAHSNRIRSVLPVCLLFLFWLIAFVIIRSDSQRTLKREMQDLEDATKED